jgi:hypothetical protein
MGSAGLGHSKIDSGYKIPPLASGGTWIKDSCISKLSYSLQQYFLIFDTIMLFPLDSENRGRIPHERHFLLGMMNHGTLFYEKMLPRVFPPPLFS